MSRCNVDPSAIVEGGAEIGKGTRVWHFSVVRSGATIGRECIIGDRVFIDTGVVIGDRVKVGNGASIFKGVTIGDGAFVGPGVVFTNDRYPRSVTPAGELASAADWEVIPTKVEAGASVGANATVGCGLVIGSFSMVGAGAVVTGTVRPYELVYGNPARRSGWVCRCGRRLPPDTAMGGPGVLCEVCSAGQA